MSAALHRVAEIAGLGMRAVEVPAVPARRVIALARYGMAAKAPKLAEHPYARKLATLLATVRWLEVQATDDALELFDVFMTNELIGRAGKNADRQKLRRLPTQSKHVAVLASAVQVLLEADTWGDAVPLDLVWEAIDTAVGSRARLAAAVAGVQEMIPPPAADAHGQWRAQVVERFATVRPFVRLLCEVIEFGATVDAAPVLAAMRDLAQLLEARPSERVLNDAGREDVGWAGVACVERDLRASRGLVLLRVRRQRERVRDEVRPSRSSLGGASGRAVSAARRQLGAHGRDRRRERRGEAAVGRDPLPAMQWCVGSVGTRALYGSSVKVLFGLIGDHSPFPSIERAAPVGADHAAQAHWSVLRV